MMKRWVLKIVCFCLLPSLSAAQVAFEDITETVGIGSPGESGVAWFDYNNDGWLDLLVLADIRSDQDLRARLFVNDQGTLKDVTQFANLHMKNISILGAALGDYDNDGHVDINLVVEKGNVFFRNKGDGTFEERTQEVGVDTRNVVSGLSTSFVDIDNDGHLDLFVGDLYGPGVLFRNNGDATFTDISETAGIVDYRNTRQHMFGDYDNDGFMDLYVGNTNYAFGLTFMANRPNSALATEPGILYRNNGNGTFSNVTTQAGLGHDITAEVGVLFFDSNNDGWLDLFLSVGSNAVFDIRPNVFYQNNGNGTFRDVTTIAGVKGDAVSTDIAAGDFDNDGWMDLIVSNYSNDEKRDQLLWNDHEGRFFNRTNSTGATQNTRQANFADFDNDGFLDLMRMAFWGGGVIHKNGGNANHWLHLDLVGVQSNRSAIGARVHMMAGDLSVHREVNGGNGFGGETLLVELGLDSHMQADRIEIKWPSGQVDVLNNVSADQRIRVLEGSGTYHNFEMTEWVAHFPTDAALFSPFGASASVRPALFEPQATVTRVVLEGLGEHVVLQDLNDGTYRLPKPMLVATGVEGERMLTIGIEQMTSIGVYRTTLPLIVNFIAPLPPTLVLAEASVSFGQVDLDRTGRSSLNIKNEGLGPLLINGIRTDVLGLAISDTMFTIQPGELKEVSLSFNPQLEGAFSGVLEILSNDVDQGVLNVNVSGSVVVILADPRADVDGSGTIDFPDFLAFAKAFGSSDTALDFDDSGVVDFPDFLSFVQVFGKSVE